MSESRYNRLKGWAKKPWSVSETSRSFFSAGVGASFASTVSYVIELVQPYAEVVGTAAYETVNYTATGLVFLGASWSSKRKFDESHEHTVRLEAKVDALDAQKETLSSKISLSKQQLSSYKKQLEQVAVCKDAQDHTHIVDRIHQSLGAEHEFSESKLVEYKQKESRFKKLGMWTPTRWVIAGNVAADLASGVHYCLGLVTSAAKWTTVPSIITNGIITGGTFLATTKLANRKLKADIQHLNQYGERVTNIEGIHRDFAKGIAELKFDLALQSQVLEEFDKPIQETKLELMDIPVGDSHVIDIRVSPEEASATPGPCKTLWKKVKDTTLGVFTGAGFASGAYYCGELGVTLATWALPVGPAITAIQYSSYALTAVSFVVTTNFALQDMEASPLEFTSLGQAVKDLQIQQNGFISELAELETALHQHRETLMHVSEQVVNQTGDDETLHDLMSFENPISDSDRQPFQVIYVSDFGDENEMEAIELGEFKPFKPTQSALQKFNMHSKDSLTAPLLRLTDPIRPVKPEKKR